jgi:hypothetical protein
LSRLNFRRIASLSGFTPSCGGYLVSPARAALWAASMACGGVGKSGSPDDRPTIFTPCARSSRTLRVMAADADTLMFLRRSATSNIPAPYFFPRIVSAMPPRMAAEASTSRHVIGSASSTAPPRAAMAGTESCIVAAVVAARAGRAAYHST